MVRMPADALMLGAGNESQTTNGAAFAGATKNPSISAMVATASPATRDNDFTGTSEGTAGRSGGGPDRVSREHPPTGNQPATSRPSLPKGPLRRPRWTGSWTTRWVAGSSSSGG